MTRESFCMLKRGWDKNPSLSIVFGLSSKTQWLSGGTMKSNSNELPISVPLSSRI